MKKFIIPLFYALIIILLAFTDALFYNGNKAASKAVEELGNAVMLAMPLIYAKVWDLRVFGGNGYAVNWRVVVLCALTYLFLRIALFDVSFNLFASLPIIHNGTTDYWNNFIHRTPIWQIITLRGGFLTLTILIWAKWKL